MDTTHNTQQDRAASVALPIKEKLSELVRYASITRAKTQANAESVVIGEMESSFQSGRILAPHMAFILISGETIRITFKAHFSIRSAKRLAFRIYGGASAEQIRERQAIDFVKEYTNLVAGNLVTRLSNVGVEVGISLPLATSGFYEVFADYIDKQIPTVACSDFWELDVDGYKLYCSAQYEFLSIERLAKLADVVVEEEDDEEMDFL
ncbi:hypothetical protein [Propionivibrio dicarboxylicus]|uniref:Chemotaxis phosphatase CheX n=1 Tax=Propionivibrio dicarboxylicus TaxID=83767 RepID=A0A1G8EQI9_9RHOO|nr:hypothetical protein [Propionivibrio dicarboxylicus]SDH72161.1 hypothetical protein SAMN05660652_02162 [Propionivibrio dicarboxylicus]